MEDNIKRFIDIVNSSKNIVFFGGAGVSTESGIPDFRSKDGLYNQKWHYEPEEILSKQFFYTKTDEFFRFYKEKLNVLDKRPNITHFKLAELEKQGKVSAVITQNIDGLHQLAGSKVVYEIHGSVKRNKCCNCGAHYTAEYVFNSPDLIPKCTKQLSAGRVCNHVIKPDVVLYGEELNPIVVAKAAKAIAECDCLIVGGTSLSVYPASGLVDLFKKGPNKYLILINKTPTDKDRRADLVLHEGLGYVFSQL